jgi:hypothetical protein
MDKVIEFLTAGIDVEETTLIKCKNRLVSGNYENFSLLKQDMKESEEFIKQANKAIKKLSSDNECNHSRLFKIKNTVIGTICLKCRYKN